MELPVTIALKLHSWQPKKMMTKRQRKKKKKKKKQRKKKKRRTKGPLPGSQWVATLESSTERVNYFQGHRWSHIPYHLNSSE